MQDPQGVGLRLRQDDTLHTIDDFRLSLPLLHVCTSSTLPFFLIGGHFLALPIAQAVF